MDENKSYANSFAFIVPLAMNLIRAYCTKAFSNLLDYWCVPKTILLISHFQFSDNKIEPSTVIKTLKHLWLVLDICVKSMAQTIVLNGSHKISRRKRFSPFTSDAMQSMFSEVSQRIVQNHKRFPAETRAANVSF